MNYQIRPHMPEYRFMLSGGGTGGHIFPALSIADKLKELAPDSKFLFVGAKDRMEMERVPAAGYEIKGLWISGIQRSLSAKNLSFPLKLISSLAKSRKLIRKFKPHAVIGTGGFASGPLLFAASSKGIPCLIQEQNSYPGITNKLLAKRVNKIAVAYAGMDRFFPSDRILLTGNPIRESLKTPPVNRSENIQAFQLDPARQTILILGGSLGARRINELVAEHLNQLMGLGLNILWQTGKLYIQDLKDRFADRESNQLQIVPFIKEMDKAFSADLVISRAGAGTISELAATQKAVLLIPSPNVAEDHQTKNAMALVQENAALIYRENQEKEDFIKTVEKLMTLRSELAVNIKKFALPNAADTIAREVLNMLNINAL